MKKSLKNLTALTLSSALAVGIITASLGPGKLSDKTLITAKANSIRSEFDPETGTLTLKGEIVNTAEGDPDDDGYYTGIELPAGVLAEHVISVVADESAVLPESCEFLFSSCTNMVSAYLSAADGNDAGDVGGSGDIKF